METLPYEKARRLELHYFLQANEHKMDAIVRNKCEHELLEIVKEITGTLGIELTIESEAFVEGGLKEFWSFLGANKNQIGLVLVILTIIFSRCPTVNKKLESLQIQDLEVSIKERELHIELLKKQLKDTEVPENVIDVEKIADMLQTPKVERHKSNFYQNIAYYDKVTEVTTTILTEENLPVREPNKIKRAEFVNYVITAPEIPVIIDENAKIQIISPVLKEENYKWRGLYNSNSIDFYMKDKAFKNSVIAEGVEFKNGTTIECVLEIKRNVNEIGEIYCSSYAVTVVVRKHDENISIDTPQGIVYLKNKKDENAQLDLFDSQLDE